MTYCTQKATKPPEKKNLACSSVQCSLAGLLFKGKSFGTDVLLSKETSITLIATQNENLFFGHPCTYTNRKKKGVSKLLSLETFHKVSAVSFI